MDNALRRVTMQLEQAVVPEDVFGILTGCPEEQAAALAVIYRRLAKVAHPDAYQARDEVLVAQVAFTRLSDWYVRAKAKLEAGVYGSQRSGSDPRQVALPASGRTLAVTCITAETPVYSVYRGEVRGGEQVLPVMVKVPRQPCDNDLAENEARILTALGGSQQASKFRSYFPELVDKIWFADVGQLRLGNVFRYEDGWYNLGDVREVYPAGVDPKDMAWIWRRLLVALGYAHRCGVIHGAVLPPYVNILPADHGLMLSEWSFAVREPETSGETITAVDPAYLAWYPQEVLAKQVPLPGTDIGMAARCMIHLLGGDAATSVLPPAVPKPLQAFFKGCLLPGRRARPQDAWALLNEFDALIHRMWGARTFHPFSMETPRR